MPLTINNTSVTDEAIAEEAKCHADSASPLENARRALAVKELLFQRACELGLDVPMTRGAEPAQDDAVIEELLAREVPTPKPTAEECSRYYESHSAKFRIGDLVEAAHILFAVTPAAPLGAIRQQAETTLKQALTAPAQFGALASRFSNCPSAAQGGNLGQLQRGQTVPEFEAAVFKGHEIGVLPRLVNTRYGFHIVRVERRIAGRQLPFEQVKEDIASFLQRQVQHKAVRQYLKVLAGKARISGVDLERAESPLLQ